MRSIFLLFTVLLLFILSAAGQEYGYTRYDSKDGLAGSTVYCMTQDKDGFLWFGTDAGLSRFDGTHFKNFTQEDGLPDNEIIQLFADSKGRIWISPFKKSICYYYKGKIHNQNNDSLLKGIHIVRNVARFAENNSGDVLMMEDGRLHLVDAEGRVNTIEKIGDNRIRYVSAVSRCEKGGFWVLEKNRLFQYNHNRFMLRDTLSYPSWHYGYSSLSDKVSVWLDKDSIRVRSLTTFKSTSFPALPDQTNFSIIDSTHIGLDYTAGSVVHNINQADSTITFLHGISISGVRKDREGNIWFTTLGQGVYRLNSASMFNLTIQDSNIRLQATAFASYKNSILIGCDKDVVYSLTMGRDKNEVKRIIPSLTHLGPVVTLYVDKGKKIYCGLPDGIVRYSPDNNQLIFFPRIITVKSIFTFKNKMLIATDRNVMVLDPVSFVITDTIWRERATTVYVNGDTIYIGSLNGLYRLLPGKAIQFMGDHVPLLRSRIASVTEDCRHVLWVATFGEGIIGIKNDSAIIHINRKKGLTSNICRAVFLDHDDLWVGTDKGLNKIDLAKPGYPLTKYTTGDGLASDIINAVYVRESKVLVGTTAGVTIFDEKKVDNESRCDLTFTDIAVSGETYYPSDIPSLIPHTKNNLQFNYVGISYKSAGDIRYRYRLLGLDSNWKETRETFLSYPTLPSGDYQLQIQAINKFDVVSNMITTSFTIDKLLLERTWFRLLIGVVFLAVINLLIWIIIRRIRRREQEKTSLNKRIGELEQLARKAQMNPHFIFNSLNSIQQYVMDADITGANKFISGFSRLIRQTLDFSSRHDISLEQELDYLSNYLELERTRLENAFGWSVSVAADVNTAEYQIPPMILQPFVENSVRHGLRFRRDREGQVNIHIKRENNYLVCILEDNGIGRKAALKLKSVNVIEYQSKGMSLTAERIAMLNKDNPNKITMQIEDLEDGQHNALGTRVTISFPDADAGMQ